MGRLKDFLNRGRAVSCSPNTVQFYTCISSIVSILLNLILFGFKLLAGSLSGSVAIMGDAYNNLADAGTCLAELLGFTIAGYGAGDNHPFGHGRVEWLMGLIASVFILLMGAEMAKSSAQAIFAPSPVEISPVIVVILVVSIAVKGCMFFYNRNIGKVVSSVTMKAKAYDCLSDMAATTLVLFSSLAGSFLGWQIDGWCGIAVSVFVCYSGLRALKEAAFPLMGAAPDPDLTEKIRTMSRDYPQILGIHELMVHDYGFQRLVLSFHISVEGKDGKTDAARTASDFSARLYGELGCEAVIQVDVIENDPAFCDCLLKGIEGVLQNVDLMIRVDQFRLVQNLDCRTAAMEIFVPPELMKKELQILDLVKDTVKIADGSCRVHARLKMTAEKSACTKKAA